jgi:hypothetical protein
MAEFSTRELQQDVLQTPSCFESRLTQFDSLLIREESLQAVELLRTLNQERRRTVPENAPLKFIPATWHPYVVDRSGRIDRRYYELCALWELRAALRAGDVWPI